MKIVIRLIVILVLFASCSKKEQFEMLGGEVTGIEFNNKITESDSFNILTYEYIYNGGGVAIADFDNNGLADIYFTGNMVSNELYLNKGNLKFRNVTAEAGVSGDGKWNNGVAVTDLNADGWMDIFICATGHPDSTRRKDILYVNKGLNGEGVPTFVDEAADYGLADAGHSTNAAFLDYDNDGDMDLFLALNKMKDGRMANVYRNNDDAAERIDKLFRNDWPEGASHPIFTDVSSTAGIVEDGYSLGVNVSDINQDGLTDIYVTNDYLTNDIMFINKGDGTFENKGKQYFKHTSYSAMGNDVVDINNDARPDVIALDMLPEDNYRRKTMLGPNNYTTYINNEKYGYQYQYVKNTFQLNQGNDPRTGDPVFSEVGFLSGVSATDWSWTPLVADFDNDGFRDIIITNGFPRDITDRDFIDYYAEAGNYASKSFLMQLIPSVKIKNYAYRNTGGYIFEDVTDDWGIKVPSFSNGAAYADLDNDGDLDYVVNNINDRAFLFENHAADAKDLNHNWLRISLKGHKMNPYGLGAKVNVYLADGRRLYSDHTIYRGYLSSVDPVLHFGLKNATSVDSIVVTWSKGLESRLFGTKANQLVTIDIASATKIDSVSNVQKPASVFTDVSEQFGAYTHSERDYVDFNVQPLLLHKLSQYGPGVAVGDVNSDGRDDLYVGGSHYVKGSFFVQQTDGQFSIKDLVPGDSSKKAEEELGVLLFDADMDGDQDLYTASGGNEHSMDEPFYNHRFYENKGGTFVMNDAALPGFKVSGSCVRAADYDRDGDLDLFVGGRVMPHKYPLPVSSYLLENVSTNGTPRFQISTSNNNVLKEIGLVCDAVWSDFDNDHWVDLIVAGEWMAVRFFRNDKGNLVDVTSTSGINNQVGWWNSIAPGDFDRDGDVDYVVGNLGHNTLMKASDNTPVSIYAADFDMNDNFDMLPTTYFKDRNGVPTEFPFFGRLDMQKELIRMKRSFLKYSDFGVATMDKVLPEDQRKGALIYRANWFSTSYVENLGGGKFAMRALPTEAQFAPVYGMIVDDVNGDGNQDVIAVGNDYGTEVSMGRYDALNGLLLLGDGKGNFKNAGMNESGICVKGDAKGLATIFINNKQLLVSTTNQGKIIAYEPAVPPNGQVITLSPDVSRVEYQLAGLHVIKEVYHGNGFLSQSSRKLVLPKEATHVILRTFKDESLAANE
jgi:hypothetical protein